jgi:DNA-binding XRE family transcriptional regulator
MTQIEAAAAIGVTAKTWGKYERGRVEPPLLICLAMAGYGL